MTTDDTHDETLDLPCDPMTVRSARAAVARILQGRGWHERDVERVKLVVSELVTNVVVHAGTDGSLRVRADGPEVRLEVVDGAPAHHPVLRDLDHRRVGGLGLQLVDAVARDWGVDLRPESKSVWCELEADFPSEQRLRYA